MLKPCKNDKNIVKQQIQNQVLDAIVASNSDFIDDIILSMSHEGVLDCLSEGFPDKRKANSFIPLNFIMALAIAAKMKTRTSLTDIPYAINDRRTLAELGYNACNMNYEDGWMNEGTLRHLIGKYESTDIFNYYNNVIQNHIFKTLDIETNIHILDCTKIEVNFENFNYEDATVAIDRKGNKMKGYKLASIRGLYNDIGIIEDTRFGTASTHDVELSMEMLKTTPCFHDGDILIMDRGFVSREMIRFLKEVRNVDSYIPMKKGMSEYEMAVTLAEESDDWQPHPTRKRQMIFHVPVVDSTWNGNEVDVVLTLNACVVWLEDTQEYKVFTTTDMSKTGKEIIAIYELRTEIEEDFRQLKDFWKLEDFKSTKLNVISFHIVCVLFGYMFYQLYLNTEDGQRYVGKCLPVILKSYKRQFLDYLVLYSGEYFCCMTMREFFVYRDECSEIIKEFLLNFLG